MLVDPDELFDICDENDVVIGQEKRGVVHARNLLHRAVHIWVWNTHGELYLHLRSALKDQFPLCFTSSASGHVDAGETYEEAAVRELREELGLSGELKFVTKLPGSEKTAYEHTALYYLTTDATPTPDPQEIQELFTLPPETIWQQVQADPNRFTPPYRELMTWWSNNQRSATAHGGV